MKFATPSRRRIAALEAQMAAITETIGGVAGDMQAILDALNGPPHRHPAPGGRRPRERWLRLVDNSQQLHG